MCVDAACEIYAVSNAPRYLNFYQLQKVVRCQSSGEWASETAGCDFAFSFIKIILIFFYFSHNRIIRTTRCTLCSRYHAHVTADGAPLDPGAPGKGILFV